MGRCRFERPDVSRLPLEGGDWIEVKRRLSGGERRRMSAAAFSSWQPVEGQAPNIHVDFAVLNLSRTKAYLVDWSLRDLKDKPVKVSDAAIEALDEETLIEIEGLLDKHIEAVEAEEKARRGAPASSQV